MALFRYRKEVGLRCPRSCNILPVSHTRFLRIRLDMFPNYFLGKEERVHLGIVIANQYWSYLQIVFKYMMNPAKPSAHDLITFI